MKNAVFWDIKTQSILHRRHICATQPRQLMLCYLTGNISMGMASSGMLHRVALLRTDVSEELTASIIRVTRIGELET
jgi:hypothetical protein